MYRTAPSCTVRTRCRLGYHLLFVLLLAWLTLWPVRGRLPHIWQTLAICSYLQSQRAVYRSCSLAILQPKKWEDCLFLQQSSYLTHLVPFDKGKTKFFNRIVIFHIYNLPHALCPMLHAFPHLQSTIRDPQSEIRNPKSHFIQSPPPVRLPPGCVWCRCGKLFRPSRPVVPVPPPNLCPAQPGQSRSHG
jgi:hypothetical protein